MEFTAYRFVEWIWIAVGIVWAASALGTKRTVRREAGLKRLLHVLVMFAAFFLLFPGIFRPFTFRALNGRFVPDSAAIAWAGAALTAAGCGFAIWARMLLGRNWSAQVTLKQDHQLIDRGPYAIVRHPIYTGFLTGLLGAAIALGEWRGLAGVALAFLGWWTKSRHEEQFLAEQFGGEYERYRQRVKALIPYVA